MLAHAGFDDLCDMLLKHAGFDDDKKGGGVRRSRSFGFHPLFCTHLSQAVRTGAIVTECHVIREVCGISESV